MAHILSSVHKISIIGAIEKSVDAIFIDSRLVTASSLFITIKGTHVDGHQFIQAAIDNGCTTIVCEQLPQSIIPNVTYIQVENTAQCAGIIAANFYEYPSTKFKLIGITGTNGKTTCVTLLHQLFTQLGYTCGLVSTIQNKIGDKIIPSTHTTPDAISLQKLFYEMANAQCQYVFMEVSSHAIHQHRIQGAVFAGAVFTNITHDHLDYHHTFDEYIRVKKLFFDALPANAFAITNVDDRRGMVMLQNTNAKKCTYSLQNLANYHAKITENLLTGLVLTIQHHDVHFRLIGEFNAYNLLAVYATACELQQNPQEVLQVLSNLQGAEGRFDYILSPVEKIVGIVDYAHTPDALLNVLATINKLRNRNETLFTVIGCGGNRDRAKRPLMARVACEHSDKVIFTSDNPRNENPIEITQQMQEGVPVSHAKKVVTIMDRKEAIKVACTLAEQGDIVLVAGKGHEKYQEINEIKYPFDDKQQLLEYFKILEK